MNEHLPRHAAPDRPPLEAVEADAPGRHELPDEERWLEIVEPKDRQQAFSLYLQHGEAARGYIDEIYPDVYDQFDKFTSLEDDFTDHYIGSYDDIEDWAKEYVEEQGWTFILRETMRQNGIPEDLIEFNYEPLLAMAYNPRNFQIIWGETKVHLFFR